MTGAIEASSQIRSFLKEKIPRISDEEITYVDGYLKTKTYEEKLRTGDKDGFDSDIPFILIRPGKQKQRIEGGATDRNCVFNMRIVTKDPKESGYASITELAEQVINLFTEYPAIAGGYSIDMSEVTGEMEDEMCVGDYWTYLVQFKVNLPVKNVSILKQKGWV